MSARDFTPLESRIDPASAEARLPVLRSRLAALDGMEAVRKLTGEETGGWMDPAHFYRRVVRAQIELAECQIRVAPRTGPQTDARPPQESVGPDHG